MPLRPNKVRDAIVKMTRFEERGWPAVMGSGAGYAHIETGTPNKIWVTHEINGIIEAVWNLHLPAKPGLHIIVGEDKTRNPGLRQVLRERTIPGVAPVLQLPAHHQTHELYGDDEMEVFGGQFHPLNAIPIPDTFIVLIKDAIILAGNVWAYVPEQNVDLTASVPAAGAIWALLQADSTGVVTAKLSAAVTSRSLLTVALIPLADTNCFPMVAIKLFDGQASLRRDKIRNDFFDLRWGNGYLGGTVGMATITEITSADSPYTVLATDETVILTSGDATVRLAGATGSGRKIIFKVTSSGVLTINADYIAGSTIDGATAIQINPDYGAVIVQDMLTSFWGTLGYIKETIAPETIVGNPTSSAAGSTDIEVAEQTLVGRITGGHVDDLSVAQVLALIGAEVTANKSTSVVTDQESDTKYPSVKAVYDWAVGLFVALTGDQVIAGVKKFSSAIVAGNHAAKFGGEGDLEMFAPTGANPAIIQHTFGGVNGFVSYTADDTESSPDPVPSGKVLYNIALYAHDGVGYYVNGHLKGVAAETWDATHHGVKWELWGTATGGSTTEILIATFYSNKIDLPTGSTYDINGSPHTHASIGAAACGFLAYNSATDTDVTGDNTSYTIIFNTEVQDTGSNYNNTTGVFTAPYTGFYIFNTNCLFRNVAAANHTELDLNIVVAGTSAATYTFARVDITSGFSDFVLNNSAIAYMTVGDTCNINAIAYGNSKVVDIYGVGNPYTRFSGKFLGI